MQSEQAVDEAREAPPAIEWASISGAWIGHALAPPCPQSCAFALFLAAASTSAGALVGAAPDERFADRVAMVLMRGPGEAGFCSALVLDDRTLLTAAHCLRPVRDMAVHYRDAAGAPVVIPVEAAVAHPQYRPDAIRARVEFDRHRAHSNRPAAGPPFRRRGAWRPAMGRPSAIRSS